MLEIKDIIDVVVGGLTAVSAWLVKGMYARPTHDEVRQLINDNQKLNNYAIDEIKEDLKEMKESNRAIQSELSSVKEMLIKALNKS